VSAVRAFDAVGSILVVALMIGPPATAYMLTGRLPRMIGLSGLVGVVSAISGYWLARVLDASIAGSMATMAGVLFGLAFLLASERGLMALARRRARQRREFAQTMLAIHLFNHEGLPATHEEFRIEHMRWEPAFTTQVVRQAERRGIVLSRDGYLSLTERGRQSAQQAILN
jgi:manganese/zinc/iron transport system permease protein